MIEKIFISVPDQEYVVHIKKEDEMKFSFEVYPIDVVLDESLFFYWDKQTSATNTHIEFGDDCLKQFEGTVGWRGVWESRLYFTDDEYWGDNLEDMYLVWKQLYPILRDKIEQLNPDYKYFDK
jgi:hypothetical protein